MITRSVCFSDALFNLKLFEKKLLFRPRSRYELTLVHKLKKKRELEDVGNQGESVP